jgi:hypothetical protein
MFTALQHSGKVVTQQTAVAKLLDPAFAWRLSQALKAAPTGQVSIEDSLWQLAGQRGPVQQRSNPHASWV